MIPGTIASLVSILILFPIFYFKIFSFEILILIFIFIFFLSVFSINEYSKKNSKHDDSSIVIDEFIGIYLIFLFYTEIYIFNHLFTNILIFLLFRFFDITKIFPANIVDKKIKNPFGVMLDDIIASFYTILIMYILNVYL